MELDLGDPLTLPGVEEKYARVITTCAAVCLDHHAHPQAVLLQLEGSIEGGFRLRWRSSTNNERAWYLMDKRDRDTIRWGAECVAISVVTKWLGLVVKDRGPQGTGVDFFLGEPTKEYHGYQGMIRLEVSGILSDNQGRYRQRLAEKLQQMRPSADLGSGYAAIVMFGTPKANVTASL